MVLDGLCIKRFVPIPECDKSMTTFVDILEHLKHDTSTTTVEQAWTAFQDDPRHVTRVLKTDVHNMLAQHTVLHAILEYSALTVQPYLDTDGTYKITIRVAFVPANHTIDTATHEQVLFETLQHYVEQTGLTTLVNDICVNHLQRRYEGEDHV